MAELIIKASQERIKNTDLGDFYRAQGGDLRAAVDVLAHFVVGENGAYLPKAEAVVQVLDGRTLGDVETLFEQLRVQLEEAAVPKE